MDLQSFVVGIWVSGVVFTVCRFQQIDRHYPVPGMQYLWYVPYSLVWPLTWVWSWISRNMQPETYE